MKGYNGVGKMCIISYMDDFKLNSQSIPDKLLATIRRRGRGSAFSQRDFARMGERKAVDMTLSRLADRGHIRRVIRGIYDYPRYSELLKQEMAPDIDQVAQALARKFGWRIHPSGPTAENLIGLSTQVPSKYLYQSDGRDRSYRIGKTVLAFEHTPLKEAGFKHPESVLIVAALKSLGEDRITEKVIAKVRDWLPPELRPKVLKDTEMVTGWVYAPIRKICREGANG